MIIYDFNRYVQLELADLLANDVISPVQEPPEETGNFMLYEFETRPSAQTWLVQQASITYECWSPSYDQAVEMDQRLLRLTASDRAWRRFFRWRNSAEQVALHDMPCYTVQSLTHMFAGDLPPPDEEAGKFGRIIVIELKYTLFDIEE